LSRFRIFRFGCDRGRVTTEIVGFVLHSTLQWWMLYGIVSTDDDGYFLFFDAPPSLRGSVDFFVACELVQALVFNSWKKKRHKYAYGLRTQA